MIKHVWSVLCQNSIEDRETNNINLLVLEQLSIDVPKDILERNEKLNINNHYELVGLWNRVEDKSKDNEGDVIIELFSPQGDKLFENAHPLVFEDKQRMRTRLRVQGLPLTTAGFYSFHVSLKIKNKKSLVAEIPLQVDIHPIPQEKDKPIV